MARRRSGSSKDVVAIFTILFAIIGAIVAVFSFIFEGIAKLLSSRGNSESKNNISKSSVSSAESIPQENYSAGFINRNSDYAQDKSARISSGYKGNSSNYEWLPYGKSVNIAGYDIHCGMMYVGKAMGQINNGGTEPALINPALPVSRQNSDLAWQTMSYYPSYSNITPNARAAYLSWLSSGRNNPEECIGYVFLYFYGLERRLFYDLQQGEGQSDEAQTIIDEVKRLIKIYGYNSSFRRYATSFLNMAVIFNAKDDDISNLKNEGYNNWEIPLGLKLKLGRLATEGKPLSSELALSYIENNPMVVYLRTPAKRCPQEFKRLFHICYGEKHGQGIMLKTNKTPLKATYRPASASFGGELSISAKDVPDVTVLKQPWQNIFEMADACVQELDAYSRYLGRNPDKFNTAEAQALLPRKLLNIEMSGEMKQLSEHLTKLSCGKEMFSAQITEILDKLPTLAKGPIGKKELVSLAQILEKLGYGIEPDVRFYSQAPRAADQVIIFSIPDDSASSPSVDYSLASLMIQLATMVANADVNVSIEEERVLANHLENLYHLSENERTRLKALMTFHLIAKTSFAGNKKRIESLSKAEREMIGKFILQIAHADNKIDPAEVNILERLYEGLGLDMQTLYSALHTPTSEPVAIVTADKETRQYTIPTKPSEKNSAIKLDKELITAKMQEAATVSSLLDTIFSEEEQTPSQPLASETSESVNGMDSETASFMKQLLQRTSWKRGELEELAAKANIMLDGVFDSINDACIEKCGEPLFDDGETIELNEKVAKEMMA